MRPRTVEITAAAVGILVPLSVVIWLGARTVDTLDETVERVSKIEERLAGMAAKQIEDSLINQDVVNLETAVDWLKYHHHGLPGELGDTGRAHVD